MKTIKLPCYGIVLNLTGDGGGTITSNLEDYEAEDAIESIILGHAIAGVDVESNAYIEGIETAVQAIGNNLEM